MSTFANIALIHRDGSDFSDLDTDLDAEVSSPAAELRAQHGETFLEAAAKLAGAAISYEKKGCHPAVYKCERCHGTGRKAGGVCYRCEGSGKQKRKPVDRSPEAATKRAETRMRKEERRNAEIAAYRREHAHVFDWLDAASAKGNSFAVSLLGGFERFGRLTDGQITAVQNILVEDERREAERIARAKLAAEQAPAAAPINAGLDLRPIPAGRYAVPNGDTRLKVLIEKPLNEDGKPTKWHGWIFVSDGAEYGQQRKYGRQAPGKTYSGMIQDELRIIVADPKAAAIAYGKLTGRCAICGRALENEESVERGIGPICADKAGW